MRILERYADKFLPHSISDNIAKDLDGKGVANWLESIGEKVLRHYDTGGNGLAITASGYKVSTNGYVATVKEPHRR